MFLSTERRRAVLAGVPDLTSVAVLAEGPATTLAALRALVRASLFKTARWRDALRETALARGLDVERVVRETDPSDLMEGLYIKVEEDEVVAERYKLVRADFATAISDAAGHWLDRPIVPNRTIV